MIEYSFLTEVPDDGRAHLAVVRREADGLCMVLTVDRKTNQLRGLSGLFASPWCSDRAVAYVSAELNWLSQERAEAYRLRCLAVPN